MTPRPHLRATLVVLASISAVGLVGRRACDDAHTRVTADSPSPNARTFAGACGPTR